MNNKKRTRFIPGFLLGMFAMLVVVAGICVGMYYSGVGIATNEKSSATSKAEAKLQALEKVIDKYYLEDVDESKLEEYMYKGLFQGLEDPYSVYYTAEEYKELQESTSGSYCGIGAVVTQISDTGVIYVVKAYKDAPAYKTGIRDGDCIYTVDGNEVTGTDIDKVVADMRGDEGTDVKITVYRSSTKKYIDFTVTRDEVDVPTVSSKMIDKKNKIGYIQISQFDTVTLEQFEYALSSLKRKGMEKVIFDLRNNPGGSYSVVCSILDEILPEGTIVYTKDKYGNGDTQTSNANCLDMPMVVLQNEDSASASEIFAGAVQDFGVGKIIGTKSYGKGIVQTVVPLTDGSAIKLTIEKYYTPKGRNIHGKGITPDIKVEQPENAKKDVQLKKALTVLRKEK